MNRIRYILLSVAIAACMTAAAQKSITGAEYWIDADLSSVRSATSSVDISALQPGMHSYSMRVKDSGGLWSAVMTKFFIITPAVEDQATAITAREYWIDGQCKARATLTQSPAAIDIGSLATGIHCLSVRVRDDKGRWSPTLTKYFFNPVPPESETTIDLCHYWFNDSMQNAQNAPLEAVAGIVDLDISHLKQGEHTLYWQVRDSKGAWSKVYSETFRITIDEYLLGDINNDGMVDIEDVNIIINIVVGRDKASKYGHRCYITDDETVDVSDLNMLINIMLGKN